MVRVSIKISQNLRTELKKMKLYNKETYEEVIWNIIEDTKELSKKTKTEIEEARKRIKKGEFVKLSDIEKRYNIK